MELNPMQQEIVQSDARHILVVSSAASGKSTVLVERLNRLLAQGINPSSIVAITYTNMAAENIRERLNTAASGIFIGTVHGYANYLLLKHGYETHHYLQVEDFNGLFRLINRHLDCIEPVDYLLVDEAQDSTDEQFNFFEMLHATHTFFVGDWRQSIYRYSNANPDYLLQMQDDPETTVFHLNQNYRCGSEILNFAKNIIRLNGPDYSDDSIAMASYGGEIRQVKFSAEGLARGIQKYGHYKDWFVLCRTNDEVEVMRSMLRQLNIPCDTFKKKDLTLAQLNERMKADTVKVLTIHASKGLEADYVAVIDARYYSVEEKCISYVAATRARKLLVWTTMPSKRRSHSKGTTAWE